MIIKSMRTAHQLMPVSFDDRYDRIYEGQLRRLRVLF
jgi:hypothetical protein